MIEEGNFWFNYTIKVNGNVVKKKSDLINKQIFHIKYGKSIIKKVIDVCDLRFIIEIIEENKTNELTIKVDGEFLNKKLFTNLEIENKSQKAEFLKERGVKSLYHFTTYDNLKSINEMGELIPRDKLEKMDIKFERNDQKGCDAISLSISFPNYKNFFVFRKSYNLRKYVVLEIDLQIVDEYQCYFFPTNGARKNDLNNNNSINDLKKMFSEYIEYADIKKERKDLKIPDEYTTDPQAEVRCKDIIKKEYIKTVFFTTDAEKSNFIKTAVRNNFSFALETDGDLFKPRSDFESWEKENL